MTREVLQRVGAGVAVLRDVEEVLLVRRGDNGRWDLPGGGVNVGEEVGAAARRELREETGLSVGPLSLLGVFSGDAHHHTYPDGNVVAWVTVLYTGAPPHAGDDACEVAWWSIKAPPQDVGEATRVYFRALGAPTGSV